jgi:hypothetical protein
MNKAILDGELGCGLLNVEQGMLLVLQDEAPAMWG